MLFISIVLERKKSMSKKIKEKNKYFKEISTSLGKFKLDIKDVIFKKLKKRANMTFTTKLNIITISPSKDSFEDDKDFITAFRHEISHGLAHQHSDCGFSPTFLSEQIDVHNHLEEGHIIDFDERFAYWIKICNYFYLDESYIEFEQKMLKKWKEIKEK